MLVSSRISESACHYWLPIQWIVVRIRVRRGAFCLLSMLGMKEMRATNKYQSLMTDHQTTQLFIAVRK